MKYKAFISYRHLSGGRQAVALETALKRYAKPTLARPMKIFRDEKHLAPGGDLKKSIDEGLRNSEYLIFLAEKAAAESPWCQKELEDWCRPDLLNRAECLIIVLIDDHIAFDGINHVHWEQTTALPQLLQPYLTSIPLYMDLRWAKSTTDTDLQHPKYRHEINALAARLRGVNPEDLNDEEIRVFRRNIRLRNGAIAVLLAMLLISVGATFWALNAQKKAEASAAEALRQQQIAEANAVEARRQQQIADSNAVETIKQQKIAEVNATEAKKQQQIAEINTAEAKKQQQVAKKNLNDKFEQERQKERLKFEKYIDDGDAFAAANRFEIALRCYLRADSIMRKFPDDQNFSEKNEILLQKIRKTTNKSKSKQ